MNSSWRWSVLKRTYKSSCSLSTICAHHALALDSLITHTFVNAGPTLSALSRGRTAKISRSSPSRHHAPPILRARAIASATPHPAWHHTVYTAHTPVHRCMPVRTARLDVFGRTNSHCCCRHLWRKNSALLEWSRRAVRWSISLICGCALPKSMPPTSAYSALLLTALASPHPRSKCSATCPFYLYWI